MKNFFNDKIFYKNLFILIVPIILQELLNSSVNLVDNFMVGQLEEVAITAVGICNQIFFVFNLVLFGINSGASVFIGQYFGKNDFKGIYRVIGIGLILSIINALIFFVSLYTFPKFLMQGFSKDILVINEGIGYLQIIAPAYIIISIIMSINSALKSIRKTTYPMITTFISLISNIILNYIFIFMLNLGVKGAALATLCARCIELFFQILIIYIKKLPIIARLKDYFNFDKKFLKKYFAICTPVILNEVFWSVGVAVCNMAYKYSGTNAQAAVQIAGTIQNLFVVIGVAIGGGCAILISNTLGYGDKERAVDYSDKCMFLTVVLVSIMSVILIFTAPFIANLFNITNIVKGYTTKLLYVVSVGMVFKTFNYTTIIGILRSGGDTKYTLWIDFVTVWFVGVPMAFLGAYFLNLPIYITYALVYLEEISKGFFTFHRVKQKKWVKTIISNN